MIPRDLQQRIDAMVPLLRKKRQGVTEAEARVCATVAVLQLAVKAIDDESAWQSVRGWKVRSYSPARARERESLTTSLREARAELDRLLPVPADRG